VIQTAATEDGAGATYTMQRNLPTGNATNVLEVVSRRRPAEFVITTTSGPTPFTYDIELTPANGGTVVKLNARAELGRIGDLIGPVARTAVKRGVHENLATLKRSSRGRQTADGGPLLREPAGAVEVAGCQ
jgi:hypothetical protein